MEGEIKRTGLETKKEGGGREKEKIVPPLAGISCLYNIAIISRYFQFCITAFVPSSPFPTTLTPFACTRFLETMSY